MSGKFLLDTTIVIALFAKDAAVQQRLADDSEIFVPSIVLGELYYGAHTSAHMTANVARINEFAASNTVLVCGTATAQQHGQIKNGLRAKGRPIDGPEPEPGRAPGTVNRVPARPGGPAGAARRVERSYAHRDRAVDAHRG